MRLKQVGISCEGKVAITVVFMHQPTLVIVCLCERASQWLAWSLSFARELWNNGTGIVSTPCFISLFLTHDGVTGCNFIFQRPGGQQYLFSTSHMVSHPRTSLDPLCLTSVLWRELVFSKKHRPMSDTGDKSWSNAVQLGAKPSYTYLYQVQPTYAQHSMAHIMHFLWTLKIREVLITGITVFL